MTQRFLLNKSIKLLVCDMAGTTINEGGLVYKTLYDTIKGYDIYIEKDAMKKWYGINKIVVLKHYINNDIEYRYNEAILPQMLNGFKSNLRRNYREENAIRLIDPGLPDLLNGFRERGTKVVLNTGYPSDIQTELVKQLNMNEFIDGYISSEDVTSGRPEPDMIHELMRRHSITDPNQVVKIGDSMNDILEGKNAKCHKSIGVLSGEETMNNLLKCNADIILDSIMDLY